MKFVLAIVLLVSTAANAFVVLEDGEALSRTKREFPFRPTLPPGTEFTPQGVPIVRSSYSADRHRYVNTHYDGRRDLDHYGDYVNDPWKNTENLEEILTTRQRPELRSGRVASQDDSVYPQRNQRQWSRQDTRPAATQNHWAQQSENQRSQVRTRDRSTRPTPTPQPWSNPNSAYSDGGDQFWEVASRGDNHVTYRRRNPHRRYDVVRYHDGYNNQDESSQGQYPPLRQFGEGDGKVMARVVDMRQGNQQSNWGNSQAAVGERGRTSYQASRTRNTDQHLGQSYHSARYNQPELRSLDTNTNTQANNVLAREGNWVKTSESNDEVTWVREGTQYSGSGSSSRSSSGLATRSGSGSSSASRSSSGWDSRSGYYGGAPRGTSASETSWAKVYTSPQANRRTESWTARPTQFISHYPILMDRETAEKTNRNGPNVMIQ